MTHFQVPDKGSFRICQFTDIHLDTTKQLDEYEQTLALMQKAIAETSPDLVVITGDIAWGTGDREAVDRLAGELAAAGVPWAPVLGNHDGERLGSGREDGRRMFAELLLGRENCIFEMGPEGVDGWGNYIVTVGGTAERPDWALYMLDSHDGSFALNQIIWYIETSAALRASCGELSFFHVPLPEYTEVWDYELCVGFNQERVCATDLNDGLFAAMVRGGAMRGVFVGHDHINDYEGTLNGIRLCYGRGSGYQCYGLEGYAKGARIIDIAGEKSFKSMIYLETGEMYEQTTVRQPMLRRK